jgi:hypothetical protein
MGWALPPLWAFPRLEQIQCWASEISLLAVSASVRASDKGAACESESEENQYQRYDDPGELVYQKDDSSEDRDDGYHEVWKDVEPGHIPLDELPRLSPLEEERTQQPPAEAAYLSIVVAVGTTAPEDSNLEDRTVD